jgi:hypothetical protein
MINPKLWRHRTTDAQNIWTIGIAIVLAIFRLVSCYNSAISIYLSIYHFGTYWVWSEKNTQQSGVDCWAESTFLGLGCHDAVQAVFEQKHLLQRCHPSSVWTEATHNSCVIIIFRYFPRWPCHKLGALEKTPIPEAFNPAPLGVGRTSSRWLVRCSCGCFLEDWLRGSNVETKSNQSTVTQSEWHMTSQSKR